MLPNWCEPRVLGLAQPPKRSGEALYAVLLQ